MKPETDPAYMEFIEAKKVSAPRIGFEIDPAEINPILKPHQRDVVAWNVTGGRRADFLSFGLGKTLIQLETLRICREKAGADTLALQVLPLGVRQEFTRDARDLLGLDVRFIRRFEEVDDPATIYLTNYESVRDGKLDPLKFTVASLDEASVLRGFGGTKTFRRFMALFAGDDRERGVQHEGVPYRFVATATPSPNDYIELLAYAAYLGIMDVSLGKTRFFARDSEKADALTLHPHKVDEFWQWVATWAIFLQKPSDLGHDDTGYSLPELDVRWHEIPSDYDDVMPERDGQGRLYSNAALGLSQAAREKRDSLPQRVAKVVELLAEDPEQHAIIWHDLEAERHAIQKAIPGAVSVWGTQDLEERERRIIDFSDGAFPVLSTKPVIAGSGCNLQRYCHRAVYSGIGFKFNDFIQSVHRLHRFLQTETVRIDMLYTEAEREIRRVLERKWRQHTVMVDRMSSLIRRHGLAHAEHIEGRTSLVNHTVIEGPNHWLACGDAVDETMAMADDSVHMVITSVPFGNQYEYSPNFRDLGHTDHDGHFFEHLGFVTKELRRVLKPGRVCAIHIKDRIVPGGINGYGFQTVNPVSDQTISHFQEHGFAFLGRKTIVTDVVRENNQTYRLGWSEQCKDGTRMGFGMPEYILLFRKPPTDLSNGYADEPVVKSKADYSRSRWQIDAHGFARSNGNRHLLPEELCDLPHNQIFKLFRKWGLENVYDFEHHVKIGEALEGKQRLPVTFMLLQPPSWHPDVWTDIARMRTLNMLQSQKGKEQHLCPLQFDIVDRLIEQFTQPGEIVYDPFGGLFTVPYCAILKGRKGRGVELSPVYFADGVCHVEAAERKIATPTLFDLLDQMDAEEAEVAEVDA